MVILLVVVTFAAAIVVDALVIRRLAEKKAEKMFQLKEDTSVLQENQDRLFHEGHTWVRVKRAVVEIGLDEFTNRFVGQITSIEAPEPGTRIKKGKKIWTIHFGDRTLTQLAPITGMVFETNAQIMKNPALLAESANNAGWLVRLLPDALNQELPDLYTPARFVKWVDLQKARFIKESYPEIGMVYGDGEGLLPGAAMQLDKSKWEEISRKIFGTE